MPFERTQPSAHLSRWSLNTNWYLCRMETCYPNTTSNFNPMSHEVDQNWRPIPTYTVLVRRTQFVVESGICSTSLPLCECSLVAIIMYILGFSSCNICRIKKVCKLRYIVTSQFHRYLGEELLICLAFLASSERKNNRL